MRPPPGHVHVQEDKLLFAASQYNASSSSWSLTWWGSKYNIGLGPQNNRERDEAHSHGLQLVTELSPQMAEAL